MDYGEMREELENLKDHHDPEMLKQLLVEMIKKRWAECDQMLSEIDEIKAKVPLSPWHEEDDKETIDRLNLEVDQFANFCKTIIRIIKEDRKHNSKPD